MSGGAGLGAFAQNFGTGFLTGQQIDLAQKKETREAAKFGTEQPARELDLERKRKDQPVLDKELQVRGAKADFDIHEQDFKNTMQNFEQETRKLLATKGRNEATVGVGASGAAVANQPDELAVAREDLNNKVLDSTLRQTANIYRVAKLGDMDGARDLYNKSMLVEPGKKVKSLKFDEVEVPGADGAAPKKVQVLSIEGEDGKVRRVSRDQLEKLEEQYGATYQKAGNNIVRISRDGKVTPVYEATDVGANPETGDLYYKKGPKAGQVANPAAGGINPAPRPGGKEATRIDERVTKGRVVIDKYFGINEFTSLDAKAQPAYNSSVARMGALTRGGMDPEKAANQAVLEQNDGRLNPDGTPKAAAAPAAPGAARPGSGYAGPTPWKK